MTQTRAHSWPQCTNKAAIPQPWQSATAVLHLRQSEQVVVWLHPRHAHERGQVHKAQRLQEKQDTGSNRVRPWPGPQVPLPSSSYRSETRLASASCF